MRKFILVLLGGLLLGFVAGRYFAPSKSYVVLQNDTIWYKVDSIQTVIDTLEVSKTQIIHVYEDNASIIRDFSSDADYEYFSKFLRSRFPNNDNNEPTKAN